MDLRAPNIINYGAGDGKIPPGSPFAAVGGTNRVCIMKEQKYIFSIFFCKFLLFFYSKYLSFIEMFSFLRFVLKAKHVTLVGGGLISIQDENDDAKEFLGG